MGCGDRQGGPVARRGTCPPWPSRRPRCSVHAKPNPDHDLVCAAKVGEPAACRHLHAWLLGVVPRMLRRCGGPALVPDELVHDTVSDALLGLDGFRGDSSLDTWVFRIVRNKFADWCRDRDRRRLVVDGAGLLSLTDATGSPDSEADGRSVLCQLSRTIASLCAARPRPVVCLLAVAVWGLAVSDVARRLNLSNAAVRQNLHRARAVLRNRIRSPRPQTGPTLATQAGDCPFVASRATCAPCPVVPPPCLSPTGLQRRLPLEILEPFLPPSSPLYTHTCVPITHAATLLNRASLADRRQS